LSAADWLAAEWAKSFANALEMMTEARPRVEVCAPASAPADLSSPDCWVSIPFSMAPGAALSLGAAEESWFSLGRAALAAAGRPESAPSAVRAAYLEILTQAAAGLAATLSARLAKPAASLAAVAGSSPGTQPLIPVEIIIGESERLRLYLGLSASLERELTPATPQPPEPPPSRTLDLLMEVELPVSISFGRAELPLREVLKLNSGSIVELNRTINDPVEIIVNNCVIARGEVVVVEGNYGVRIQQVVSREERLRTLK
jgi:flagellar motor switch protein FliN/FliY